MLKGNLQELPRCSTSPSQDSNLCGKGVQYVQREHSQATTTQFTTQRNDAKFRHCPVFFCELFHHNLSYRYSTLIHARETESHLRRRLLILASLGVPDRAPGFRCFCKGTRNYNTPASNKRQVPFFCLLSFAAHGPSWFVAGSMFVVWPRCSIWIDLSMNGVHVAHDKGPCEVLHS